MCSKSGIEITRVVRTTGHCEIHVRCACGEGLQIKVSGIQNDTCRCNEEPVPKKARDRLVEFRGVTLRTSEWETRLCMHEGSLQPKIIEMGQDKAMAWAYYNFKLRMECGLLAEDRKR